LLPRIRRKSKERGISSLDLKNESHLTVTEKCLSEIRIVRSIDVYTFDIILTAFIKATASFAASPELRENPKVLVSEITDFPLESVSANANGYIFSTRPFGRLYFLLGLATQFTYHASESSV
jgi:hypothetical protein